MKNLIKSEFIKDFSVTKIIFIVIILLISIVIIASEYENKHQSKFVDVEEQLAFLDSEIETNKQESIYDEYKYDGNNLEYTLYKQIENEQRLDESDWRYRLIEEIKYLNSEEWVLEKLIQDRNYFDGGNLNFIIITIWDRYKDYSLEELINEESIKENEKNTLINLYNENSYYKYLEYQNDVSRDYIIENKIDDYKDYRAVYWENYLQLNNNQEKEKAIIQYSLNNNIKNDLEFEDGKTYLTTKHYINQMVWLTPVIILIMIVLYSGVVTGEKENNTELVMLVSKNNRVKILISKLIYLILMVAIIWIMALILFVVYAGIRYGFTEIFEPKLIYVNGNVLEINYFLYLLKDILICMIVIICFLTLKMMMEIIMNNTATSAILNILILVIAVVASYLKKRKYIAFLTYTPLPYFNIGVVLKKDVVTSNLIDFVASLDIGSCLVMMVVWSIICLAIALILYQKRDVK